MSKKSEAANPAARTEVGPQPALSVTAAAVRPRFAMRFTSTPRGARLARRLVARRLADWGHPYGAEPNETMTLIAGELTANAVRHGHVPGRDFRVVLTCPPGLLRIEVTDTRGELRPACRVTGTDTENGRGLLLVSQLAERWAVTTAGPTHPGKTVWAEVSVPVSFVPAS